MAKAKQGKSGGGKSGGGKSGGGRSGGGAGNNKPAEMLLVSSKVRQLIRDAGCNTAGDALEGLNAYVGWLIEQAAKRANENGRKTVRSHDFIIG